MSYGERVLLATQTAILLVLVGKTVLQRLAHATLLARVAAVETLVWAGLDKTDLAKSQARTAVHAAAAAAEAVLLAPACASFDAFRDYEERGDRFREIVGGLR